MWVSTAGEGGDVACRSKPSAVVLEFAFVHFGDDELVALRGAGSSDDIVIVEKGVH